MRGINGTLFAYGQTASGKTHTILGDTNELGILPLAIKDVFDHTVKQPDREFLLRASFIEIYNEEMTDLLANKKESIKILTNSENDVVVENLTTHTVISYESTMELVHKGIINRKVGITNMNERSSRSHLIFRLVIESRQSSELNISMETNGTIIAAELNVVDLAGSERAGQTGAQGIRLKESSFINTSLMSLGVVIRKLSEGDKSCHIPYRDSKLTRLLQKSLGGNARTCIICAISPVVLEETQQTLLFASQAKEVKNRPTVNEVLDDKSMMRKQMTEINLLKKKIIDLETGISHLEKNKILAEQSSYQQKIEEQRERIAILLKEIVCTGRRSVQNVVKKDNMRRLTWCPGGLLRGREVSNEDKFLSEDVEMDALDGSFEKLEFQLLKQEFEEYKAQTCSPSEYKELKEKLTALEIQYETTKNKLRDMIISQEPHEVVQTLREENSKMNEKNVALSNEIVRLQAEISSKDGKISSLIDDVASLQEQQENMVDLDFLERLKEDVNAKSLELEESRRKCELENEELVHALSDQKKLWNEQVLCLEEQKFNLEQALLEANKKITQDCKNCENFQRELVLLHEKINSLNEEKNHVQVDIDKLIQENKELKSNISHFTAHGEELAKKQLSDFDMNAKLLELEEFRKKSDLKNEELVHALADQKKLWDEQVLNLEEQKFNLEQALLEANKILHDCKNCKSFQDQLVQSAQQIDSLCEEKKFDLSKIEFLIQENEGLKLKVDQLSCIEEEPIQKVLSSELELLRQQIAFINEEKNLAVSKVEMLVQENEGLKLKVDQLSCIEEELIQKNSSGELELLRQQIASINEEKNILLSKVEMLVQENEGLKLKVNQLSCIEEELIQKNSSGELELLRQQIAFINEEKNLAVSKIEMLVQENEGLKLKVNQLSCIEEELIQKNCPGELELLRQQIAFINEEKNIAVSKVEMLVQQNEELKLKVNQLTCIEEELKEKSSPSELELLRQQIAVLNEEKNIATSKIEILVQENEGLKLKDDQFSCIDEEFQKIKLEELELLRQQINSLNEEKVFALSKIDMLIQENERLKSKVDQFSTIEESLIKKNSDELDLLKQQIDSLCGEKNSTLSKMEMLVQENEGLKLKVDQLNSIKEEITKKYSPDKLELLRQEISSVNGEKNIALSKIEMLVQENERLKSEVDQLSSIKDEFQKKSSDVELLRQQMNSHYEEKNFVLSKMDSLIQENNQLKATVEEFEFEETFVKKRLTDELDLLRQQINSLYEEKNFALSKIDTITQENKGLKSKVDKLKSEKKLAMENLKGELKILREQVESLHEEKNMTQLKIDTLTQENEQLKSKLNQFNTVEEELARKKLLDLKKSLVEEVSELKKRICKLTEVNQELLELKNEAFNEKKHLSDEVDLLNKKLSEIENDLKLSYSKNSDLIEALKKEQEDCAKKCKLSQIAYERRSGQLEAESEVLIQNLKTLQVENVQITEINKELKAEILELKKNFERKESENIIVLNEKEKLVKELKENITSLDEKLQTYDKVLLNNEDLMQRVNNLEETKLVLEQSLKKTNKEFQEMLRNQKKIEPYQAQQFQLASEKENQVLHQINNQPHITSMFENLTKQDLIEKIVHLEHHLELRKKDIAVYSDHRIEQNAKIDQLKKKNEEYVSQLKRLNQILTDCRKPSGNASTLEWEEHSISLERAKVKLESQVSYLEERKRVLKLHLDRFQQENIHLNVLLNQSDKKFEIASKESADIIKCVKEEKDKLAEEIQNLRHDNERITTGLKEAFNRMNLAENALKETKSVAESEISKRDTEIEKLSSYLLRSFERYQHYKGIAKNCLEEKCSSKSKSVKNLSVLQDATTMTENCSPNPSESNKRKSTELSEGERPKSKKKLSSSVKDGGDEAECNQQ